MEHTYFTYKLITDYITTEIKKWFFISNQCILEIETKRLTKEEFELVNDNYYDIEFYIEEEFYNVCVLDLTKTRSYNFKSCLTDLKLMLKKGQKIIRVITLENGNDFYVEHLRKYQLRKSCATCKHAKKNGSVEPCNECINNNVAYSKNYEQSKLT